MERKLVERPLSVGAIIRGTRKQIVEYFEPMINRDVVHMKADKLNFMTEDATIEKQLDRLVDTALIDGTCSSDKICVFDQLFFLEVDKDSDQSIKEAMDLTIDGEGIHIPEVELCIVNKYVLIVEIEEDPGYMYCPNTPEGVSLPNLTKQEK